MRSPLQFAFFFIAFGLAGVYCIAQSPAVRNLGFPPAAQQTPVIEDHFGIKLTDNYRWLEDTQSDETRAFVRDQNAYVDRYFKQLPQRQQILEELTDLEDISESRVPREAAGNCFFLKRLSGEQSFSIYLRANCAAATSNPKDERLIDPAGLSKDGEARVTIADVAPNGQLLAVYVQSAHSALRTVRVFSVKSRKFLDDELPEANYQSVAFAPDSTGLYYTDNDNKGPLLQQHTLGARVSADKLILAREFHSELLAAKDQMICYLTGEGRILAVEIFRNGMPATREDVIYRDLTRATSTFEVLVWGFDAHFDALNTRGRWIIQTDYNAPNQRVLIADPGIVPEDWKTLISETPQQPITTWSVVGGRLFVNRLVNGTPEIATYTLDGRATGKLQLPSLGSVSAVYGATNSRFGFFRFESPLSPPSIHRLDTTTNAQALFFAPRVNINTTSVELRQESATSSDGTRIPIFIAGKKSAPRDGSTPMLMTGTGSMAINTLPRWSAANAWFLAHGGAVAFVQTRGGAEQGPAWHTAATLANKQRTFDDWFAAAHFLIDQNFTSPRRLAILAADHGGLLVGAALTQHPELFSAAVAESPLLDMTRLAQSPRTAALTFEYGDIKIEPQFRTLNAYSPLQNIKPGNIKSGTQLPALLLITGQPGARIPAFHAFKFAAALQSMRQNNPVLLRAITGDSSATTSALDTRIALDADELSFLQTQLQMSPSNTAP